MTINHQDGWIFKKEVGITHIIATFSLIISGFIFGFSMDKRIDINATKTDHLEQSFKEFRNEMRGELKAINVKLDRLLERRSGQR
ncbi:hypothetical protein [Zooshikella ganghwensis]|uniref:Uncharacterized protein n=1 Tax=Zooshikella ganghwensis TaxID=202772 RepID=A0A4P9VGL4_9GAMM|nr:hypothetical protein [Zooshikella ganghwensis]RDH41529.1 hypothetical protein B9G39_28345 [Zooshikella ganghwensis]RDH41556.1 hypothetical protein B9G39_27805 [Zooshikella ganghwensis]